MQRWIMERRSAPRFHFISVVRIFGAWNHLSVSWFRVPIPYQDSNETRRHENRQAGKTDDTHRNILSIIYCSGSHSHSLLILRAHVLRLLDAHLDQRYVPKTTILYTVSKGERPGLETTIRGLHDKILDVYDRGYHVECVDLVWQNDAQLESIFESIEGETHGGLCMRLGVPVSL